MEISLRSFAQFVPHDSVVPEFLDIDLILRH